MPVILFSKQEIKGKDGREWVKLTGLSEKGEAVEPFLSKADYDAMDILPNVFVSPAQIKEMFTTLPVVDVNFDQRGRLQSIKS